jgi:hypothetical protein
MSLALLLLSALPGQTPVAEQSSPGGYLYQPAFCVDHELRGPARPYVPQAGDIYLSTEDQWFLARLGHKVARSGAPHHSGIVFAMPDGRLALLEGGPDNTSYIRILDLIPTLDYYCKFKRVWVRQRGVPLTPDQSCRLTAFALATADKPMAVVRMVLQAGPFRSKGQVRTVLFGRPSAAHFDPNDPQSLRRAYYCSELVAEACVAAGLLDPRTTRPSSMFPRELFFGNSKIRYIDKHLDMSAWCPPARYTPWPGSEPHLRPRPWIDGDGCKH